MKYCPKCNAEVADSPCICENCGWTGDYTKLPDLTPSGKCKCKQGKSVTQDKCLQLNSPPTCLKITVNEERYLQHCSNIALIIAHSGTMLTWSEKIREYLRITEEGEMA